MTEQKILREIDMLSSGALVECANALVRRWRSPLPNSLLKEHRGFIHKKQALFKAGIQAHAICFKKAKTDSKNLAFLWKVY
jgi:hypothetical protein